MSVFTPEEIEYMRSQRLGRLATVNAAGAPHIAPVGFRYNPDLDTIDIGGLDVSATRKYRDVQRDGRVAFVIDDVLPPWKPRGIEIRGNAEAMDQGGKDINPNFGDALIRITPTRVIAWGLSDEPRRTNARNVNTQGSAGG